jgi:glycosyltransferase involved in cell wall biosynthesis
LGLKILSIPSFFTKEGNFFIQQAIALQDKNVVTDILVNKNTTLRYLRPGFFMKTYNSFEHIKTNGLDIFYHPYWILPGKKQISPCRWSNKLLKLFDQYVNITGMPDIIHAHSVIWAGYAASLIADKYKLPYLITEHRGRFVDNPYAHKVLKNTGYKTLIKTGLDHAKKIIIVNNSIKSGLLAFSNVPEHNISCIPNMVDTSFFVPIKTQRTDKPFTFFSLGELTNIKGMDILIRAFSKFIAQKNMDVQLRIGGSGPQEQNLRKLAKDLGVFKKISFTGTLNNEEVLAEYQNAHAFILTSRFESFGVVFIEAMSAGLPVIGTRCGGPENIITKDTGYLANVDDIDNIAGLMEQMIEKYNTFDGHKIRSHVIKLYSKEIVADKLAKTYKEIYDNHSIKK